MKLTDDQLTKVAARLDGTCDSIDSALDALDLEGFDINEVESQLLDRNLERCQGCDWWMESFELMPDEDQSEEWTGFCEDCRE